MRASILLAVLVSLALLSGCGGAAHLELPTPITSGALPTSAPAAQPTSAPRPTSAPASTSAPAAQPTFAPRPTSASAATSAPPGETPAALATPDAGLLVAETLQGLSVGKMLFNPPAEMEQGRTERIELRLTKNPAGEISGGLKGRGTPQVEAVQVSTLMAVRLIGKNFDIQALNTQEQVVTEDTYTQWAWDVTPLDSGEQILHLAVTARVTAAGKEGQRDLPVVDRNVNVRVNAGYLIGGFFRDYWQWLITALLVPGVALGWRIYSVTRKKTA